MTDVHVINHGTLIGVQPLSEAAKDWMAENIHSEGWQWLGPTLFVDHRMFDNLARGMIAAGLELKD